MRFRVERTSDWAGEKSPCRGCRFVQDHDENGDPVNVWEIEINSLDELMKLVDDNGAIIIGKDKSIEIYDAYRE